MFSYHDKLIKKDFICFRYFIESNLPLPVTNDSLKRFSHMIYLSQINQAMTLKSISDVCRVHSSVAMIDPKTSQGSVCFFLTISYLNYFI
jgi:hypothetical protein